MSRIQVDPDLISTIRRAYTQDLAEKLGYPKHDDKDQLRAALKAVDDEEARMARLIASGKITESTWDGLWAEWQDRRRQIRGVLETYDRDRAFHIDNLDAALQIIAQIGTLYNGLQRSEQKELLHQIVERVVVSHEGRVRLDLRTPFAYLKELTDDLREMNGRGKGLRLQTKTGKDIIPASAKEPCSTWLQSFWGGWIRTNE